MQLLLFRNVYERFFPDRKPSKSRGRKTPRRPPPPRKDNELLKGIWLDLRREYFPERDDLDEYSVYWSSRPQKRTLASCNIEYHRVSVARELDYDHLLQWLDPLLYHEMCHAVLGESVYNRTGRSAWHGKEFKALERKHPSIKEFNRWIKSGGWETAVRSDRAKRSWEKKKRVS